jgi:peroxiredoxin
MSSNWPTGLLSEYQSHHRRRRLHRGCTETCFNPLCNLCVLCVCVVKEMSHNRHYLFTAGLSDGATMKTNIFKIALTLFLIAVGCHGSAAFAQSRIEVTTELETGRGLVPGPYRPAQSGAEDKPGLKLAREPQYQSDKPLYGRIVIGNSKDKREIAVVIDELEGQPPRIYVDTNNNRDLTDDGKPDWPTFERGVYQKNLNIKATFEVSGKAREIELPYSLYRFTDPRRKSIGVFYYRRHARSGMLKLAGKEYKVVLSSFNNQAIYSNPKDLMITIDSNRDGRLDLDISSAESFKGSEPFNIGGESYRIAEVSEMGDKVWIEVSAEKVAAKRYIAVGESAEDFAFKTIDGRDLRLSNFRGKVVMLDFWATWCGPCIRDLPDVKKIYGKFDRSKFEILGISLDGKSTKTSLDTVKKFIDKHEMKWPTTFDDGGWGNLVAKQYRVTGIPHQLIVDQNGIIRLITGGADSSGKKLQRIQETIEKLIGKE